MFIISNPASLVSGVPAACFSYASSSSFWCSCSAKSFEFSNGILNISTLTGVLSLSLSSLNGVPWSRISTGFSSYISWRFCLSILNSSKGAGSFNDPAVTDCLFILSPLCFRVFLVVVSAYWRPLLSSSPVWKYAGCCLGSTGSKSSRVNKGLSSSWR